MLTLQFLAPSHSLSRNLVVLITLYMPIGLVRTPFHADILLETTPSTLNMVLGFSTHFQIINDVRNLDLLFCVEHPSVPRTPQTRRELHNDRCRHRIFHSRRNFQLPLHTFLMTLRRILHPC